ncbi:MAG: hypothetical protein JXR76_25555 [Deltaproteobacteria bacterium]|nr:hypothetical protein [Deltaproteobacteria bacterium]
MITPISKLTITDLQFDRIRELVQQRTGLTISSSRKRDLAKRLTPFVQKAHSIEKLISQLEKSPIIDQSLVNALTIGESYFFRNHPHFLALKNDIIPRLIEKNMSTRRLRIWSAGCSTGEEPYSVAILLERDFPQLLGWDISILASDINTHFLQKAQTAHYTQWSFRGVDDATIKRYFKQTGKNEYQLLNSIRNRVSFFRLNLSTLPSHVEPMYQNCDLVLCRNVLIYFPTKLATRICEVFSNCITEDGYLLLGHSEAFPSLKDLKTVYSHATYYYHKKTANEPERALSRISLVPGLGPYDPEKMIMPVHYETPAFAGGSPRTAVSDTFTAMFQTESTVLDEDLKRVRDLSMEGELTKASEMLQKLERSAGKLDFRVYFLKALVADQQNEPEEALAHLKQAIFINKEFVIGHYYQGVIAERFGDLRTARRGYRNTCQLAENMRPDVEINEGGGIRAGRLMEIATERLKELELQNG